MVKLKTILILLLASPSIYLCAQDMQAVNSTTTTKDSAIAIASSRYLPNSFLRNFFMGNNYRREWILPVTVPVLHLSGTRFTILELGGRMQTKSLRLRDSTGKLWALRSVEKNVSGAIPPFFRNTIAEKATQDLIAGAFPYGADVVGELAYALGLAAARPQVYYVADDTVLGEYRSIFSNTLCSLEERDPGFDSTVSSLTMLEHIRGDHNYKIQQKLFLKARLLDMLIVDWDRHADNWRWGIKDSAGFHFYYAVPRDRDWAFFLGKGLLPRFMQVTRLLPHLLNFKAEPQHITSLSWKTWTIDRLFLNELTSNDWQQTLAEFQNLLTDKVIERAVHKMPASIFELDGTSFIKKLKSRRDGLQKEALKYYKFLSEEITINGSAKSERFFIHSKNDSLFVTVYDRANEQLKIYERFFKENETYFLTLDGLGGDDIFEEDENVNSGIKLKINGGSGGDTYNIKGNIKTKVYDKDSDNNLIINKGKAKFYFN